MLRRSLALPASALLLIAFTAPPLSAQSDPAKITGPDACITCHKLEGAAWQEMKHSKTFDELHRRPEAKDIAGKLGIANIKNESTCVQCHYTSMGPSGSAKVIAGVSCELCHGAGADWAKVHNVKENPNRRTDSEKLGFIPPTNTYRLASNCFQCHTVPNEKLVNTGGHQLGSPIELLAWSQGEVRHHFLGGKTNVEATPERKRLLYLVGRIVDLEFSLRGIAGAVERGPFVQGMNRRITAATAELQKIADRLPDGPAKTDVLAVIAAAVKPAAAADGAGLKITNQLEVLKAATTISGLGQKISSTYQGGDLAALDALLPTTYQGTPFTAP
jgi:hypothetical protein